MEKVNVWLKINNKGLSFVQKHLNYFLANLSNKEKYNLHIYNEDLELPIYYSSYSSQTRKTISEMSFYPEIEKLFKPGRLYNVNTAMIIPYYYFLDNEDCTYTVNIDSCDWLVYGDLDHYLQQALKILKNNDLNILSYDYIFSKNLLYSGECDSGIFTHGICLVNNRNVLKVFKKGLDLLSSGQETKNVQFNEMLQFCKTQEQIHIDWIFSLALLNSSQKYISFITKDTFSHDMGKTYSNQYNFNTKMIEAKLNNDLIGSYKPSVRTVIL